MSLRRPLRSQILAALITSIVLTLGVLGWILTGVMSREIDASLRATGREAARGLLSRSAEGLLGRDPWLLRRLLDAEIARSPDVRYAVVLDPAGQVLAHTFPKFVPADIIALPGKAGHSGERAFLLGDEEVLDFFSEDAIGRVHVGMTTSGIDRAKGRVQAFVLVASAVAAALLAGVAWHFSRPVESLVRAVSRAVEEGNLLSSPEIIQTRETDELAHAFDAAFERVRSSLELARREQAEVRKLHLYLRDVLDHLDLGVVRLDLQGRVEFANAAALGLLGPSPDGATAALSRLTPCAGETPSLPEWVRSDPRQPALFRDPVAARTFRIAVAAVRPLNEAEGRLITLSDVTAELAAAEATERSKRMAVLASLASSLAHEINTPLGVILMKSEMLLDDTAESGSPPRWREALSRIAAQSRRAGHIVRSMLFLSKQSTGKFALRPEPVLASELVKEVLTLVRDRPRQVAAAIETQVEPPDLSFAADGKAMEHLLINLVNNALDALESAPEARDPRVRLSVTGTEAEVRLTVEDNGPGIAPGMGSSLFEPFQTTKSERGGAGLGLAICRAIATEHGGEISLDETVATGARFVVRLPRGTTTATDGTTNFASFTN